MKRKIPYTVTRREDDERPYVLHMPGCDHGLSQEEADALFDSLLRAQLPPDVYAQLARAIWGGAT